MAFRGMESGWADDGVHSGFLDEEAGEVGVLPQEAVASAPDPALELEALELLQALGGFPAPPAPPAAASEARLRPADRPELTLPSIGSGSRVVRGWTSGGIPGGTAFGQHSPKT